MLLTISQHPTSSGEGDSILQGGRSGRALNQPSGLFETSGRFYFPERNQNCVHELGSLFSIRRLMVFPGRKKTSGKKSGKIPQTHAFTARVKTVLTAQLLTELQRKVLIVSQAPGPILIY